VAYCVRGSGSFGMEHLSQPTRSGRHIKPKGIDCWNDERKTSRSERTELFANLELLRAAYRRSVLGKTTAAMFVIFGGRW
jgi:hypothetical protein